MAAAITGTPYEFNIMDDAEFGGEAVTVPSDATGAFLLLCGYDGDGINFFSNSGAGGSAVYRLGAAADGTGTDFTPVEVIDDLGTFQMAVYWMPSPTTGSRFFNWHTTGDQYIDLGAVVVLGFVKDCDTSSGIGAIRDSFGAGYEPNINDSASGTLTAQTGDLVLALASFWLPDPPLTPTWSPTPADQDDYSIASGFDQVAASIAQYTPTGTQASIGVDTDDNRGGAMSVIVIKGTVANQLGAPMEDTNIGSWTDEGGATSDLFEGMNESTASDSDYAQSPLVPSGSKSRFKLKQRSGAALGDPASSSGHVLRWRRDKDADGGATVNLTVSLYQGGGSTFGAGTLIASKGPTLVPDSFTDDSLTLSGGEADSITNYADLYVEFEANQV